MLASLGGGDHPRSSHGAGTWRRHGPDAGRRFVTQVCLEGWRLRRPASPHPPPLLCSLNLCYYSWAAAGVGLFFALCIFFMQAGRAGRAGRKDALLAIARQLPGDELPTRLSCWLCTQPFVGLFRRPMLPRRFARGATVTFPPARCLSACWRCSGGLPLPPRVRDGVEPQNGTGWYRRSCGHAAAPSGL